ncbi:EfeM/EfeO family lipoprotein [Arthrobacter sp. SDTb3-6]|uniref:EfeM/EfeO family lipoprotein n=1 Tax=Arthrobacter sp. SDTb3-6 TaxID=2713571 RepID=UPI00159E2173|nr:EfeM/EfeO family lipoprotein [Arthrobacter sp. SDTb3-6]NVM98804.1 EfeM/EfeO family lipoprotein [Arthrobacter sp. SDTb3-6]
MTDSLPAPAPNMAAAVTAYRSYVAGKLATLAGQVLSVKASVGNNDLDAARSQWLEAQLTWQRVGAAYGSFGDHGVAINGLPAGLPKGAADPGFTGLHRLEYGLFHGQGPGELAPVAARLHADVAELLGRLPTLELAGSDMPLRCHEILEDSLRDNLSGNNDQGSSMALALTAADLDGTRVVLALLGTLIDNLAHGYATRVSASLDKLGTALERTKTGREWPAWKALPLAARQPVTASLGAALESLAYVPALFSTDD